MKQKLAIARALLHEPAVVFLDEPTAALDPEAAYIVREAIEDLRRAGRTIVLATHNLDEADRLCDRVAFVRGGLLRVDSPAGSARRAGRPGRGHRAGGAPADELVAAARAVPGVTAVEVADGGSSSRPTTRRPSRPPSSERSSPPGPTITEVRERASTLEDVYFDVMGVRPDRGEVE